MPDAPGFAADLRDEAVRRGLPGLFLCNVMSIGDVERCAQGFDAAVEFPPNGTLGQETPASRRSAQTQPSGAASTTTRRSCRSALARPTPAVPVLPGRHASLGQHRPQGPARRTSSTASTPELFERWLRRAALMTRIDESRGARCVFVNSWNEWAEGAHLEPDERTGRRYLEVVRRVRQAADRPATSDVATRPGHGQPRTLRHGTAVEPLRSPCAPGWPDEAGRTVADGDGAASIDAVDGRPLLARVIRARHGQPFRLRGWFYGDSTGWRAQEWDGGTSSCHPPASCGTRRSSSGSAGQTCCEVCSADRRTSRS